MGDGQVDREHAEFVKSISDDVMKSLVSRRFFEELDSRLCPKDGQASRVSCDHSYGISKTILAELGFQAEDLSDVFDVLRSRGGFCDCEILYNAADESRLKAEYWKAKVGEGPASQDAG
jgi:hypothetical protein